MRRNTVILISFILVLLIGGGGVAYFLQRDSASPAFSEVNQFLHEDPFLQKLPADRAWTLSNTKEETFTGPAPSGWLAGKEGKGSKQFQRTKYAFKDRSGILVIVLVARDGEAITELKVIGAPGDEEAFRSALLETFPDLRRYPSAHP